MTDFQSESPGMDALAREIDCIVAAPFPVSLEHLRDLLSNIPVAALNDWADSYPSHVFPLAQALIEAWDIWPRAVDVLTAFARVRPVRDAMLQASPPLLHRILKDSISSKADFDAKAQVSVAFLAEPLPEAVALPAVAQTFLFMLSNRAYKNPCTATAEPIFNVLSGACSSLPHILSGGHLATLETHVKHMMRSNGGPEAQLATMLSILILTKIPPLSGQSGDASHDLFVGENGAKTMNLVTWQVLNACKLDGALICPERHIRLARQIVSHIQTGTVREWAEGNTKFADKLWQKLSLPDVPHGVRTETLAFAASFLDPPHACIEMFESSYLADGHVLHLAPDEFSAFLHAMEHLSPLLTVPAWQSLLSNINTAVTNVMACNLRALKNLTRLIQALEAHITTTQNLRLATLGSVCNVEAADNARRFSSTPHPNSQMCVDVQASYIGLILSAAILFDNVVPLIPGPVLTRLFQKQRQLCQMPRAKPVLLQRPNDANPTSLQRKNTELPIKTPWNIRVADEVKAHADHCGERILELFGQAVSDLENRCRNVEEPLRKEQARAEASERECEQLRAQVAGLQDEVLCAKNGEQTLRNVSDGLKGRVMQLESEALSAQQVIGELCSDKNLLSTKVSDVSEDLSTHVKLVEELEKQLAQSSDEAAESLESLRNTHNLESITLSTRIAAQVDEIETLECTTSKLEQELEASRAMSRQLQDDAEASASKTALALGRNLGLEGEVESLNRELSTAQTQMGQLVESLDGLRKEKDEQQRQALSKQDELLASRDDEARKATDELEGQLQVAKEESVEANVTATKAQELAEGLEARLDEAQHVIERATAQHAETIEAKEQKMERLKRKAKQLEEERDRANAQVAKFQNNLKQMLGGDLGKTERPSETAVAMSQALLAESQVANGVESSLAETEASSPPAFAKIQARPFKVPSRQTGASTQTRRSTRSQGVLGDISPNRRLMSVSPVKQKRQSTASSSTRPATHRRSVRHSFAVASGQGEKAERTERTFEGLEDEFDDTTCEF